MLNNVPRYPICAFEFLFGIKNLLDSFHLNYLGSERTRIVLDLRSDLPEIVSQYISFRVNHFLLRLNHLAS